MKTFNFFQLIVIVYFIFISISCNGVSAAEKNGFLWKISGNGLDAPSYLFGTAHGGPFFAGQAALERVPRLNEIFLSVNQLIAEKKIDNSSSFNKSDLEMDSTYADYLNKEDQIIVDRVLRTYLNATSDKIKLKPLVLMSRIYKKKSIEIYKEILFEKFKPNTNVDSITLSELKYISEVEMDVQMIMRAMSLNYSIIGLDDLIGHINPKRTISNGISYKQQIDSLVCAFKDNSVDSIIRHQLKSSEAVKNAYFNQDLDDFELQMIELDLKNNVTAEYNDMILFDRNKKWMEHISKLILEKASLIAVGAAHLPGKDGLINLLRLQGFTVEPVN